MKNILKSLIVSILTWQVKRLINRHQPKIVGITGSYGKTTTKQAVATVLQTKYRVLYRQGNYNSEIGLPLSIFGQSVPNSLSDVLAWLKLLQSNEKIIAGEFPYDVIVLEMGADHPGDIASFMSYIKPDIGVVTAVAPVHTEGFGSVENILAEKWFLALGSKKAIVNIDNRLIKQQLEQSQGLDVITYGLKKGSYNMTEINFNPDSATTEITIQTPKSGLVKLQSSLIGEHSYYAVLAAAVIGYEFKLTTEQIQRGVYSIKSSPGRMQLLRGANDSILIDDTYNANADSMIAAVNSLDSFRSHRIIAILGSINELGELSEFEHRRVGGALRGVKYLVTIGEDARIYLADEARRIGMIKSENIISCDSPVKAGRVVLDLLEPNDVVLAKGSQNGVFAEEAIKILLLDKNDSAKLVRQSSVWINKKKEQFSDII